VCVCVEGGEAWSVPNFTQKFVERYEKKGGGNGYELAKSPNRYCRVADP